MKTICLIFILILLNASCKNDDNSPENPLDSLPPATQIGAQTFGCLVDGKVFLPKNFGINRLNAFNQNIDGFYYLAISSSSRDESMAIAIRGEVLPEIVQKTYPLGAEKNGSLNALFIKGIQNDLVTSTTDLNMGRLTITKHDTQNFILSGTFEFTVLDNDGKEIKITDGRFDVKYTN